MCSWRVGGGVSFFSCPNLVIYIPVEFDEMRLVLLLDIYYI